MDPQLALMQSLTSSHRKQSCLVWHHFSMLPLSASSITMREVFLRYTSEDTYFSCYLRKQKVSLQFPTVINIPPILQFAAGIAQSVQRLATGWTVRGPNPGGGDIFRTRPDWLWAHPASCTMGTGSLQGVKRAGRGTGHPPPSSVPRS